MDEWTPSSESPFGRSRDLVTFAFVSSSAESRSDFINERRPSIGDQLRRLAGGPGGPGGGLLMESVEKGVTYPIVHRGSIQNYFQKESVEGRGGSGNFLIEKGCYQEVEKVRADLFGSALDAILSGRRVAAEGVSSPHPPAPPPWSRYYIVLGFKQLPGCAAQAEVLESGWKDWTWARYLYLHLPHAFGPYLITFYKRFAPDDDPGLFLYLVVVECVRVTPTDATPLRDFVGRMRADKMPFYLALYKDAGSDHAPLLLRDDSALGLSHAPGREGGVRRRLRFTSSGGSTGPSSPLGSYWSDEVSPVNLGSYWSDERVTSSSSPLFGSPVAAFQSKVTFLNFQT